jgi:hypothetical protein
MQPVRLSRHKFGILEPSSGMLGKRQQKKQNEGGTSSEGSGGQDKRVDIRQAVSLWAGEGFPAFARDLTLKWISASLQLFGSLSVLR